MQQQNGDLHHSCQQLTSRLDEESEVVSALRAQLVDYKLQMEQMNLQSKKGRSLYTSSSMALRRGGSNTPPGQLQVRPDALQVFTARYLSCDELVEYSLLNEPLAVRHPMCMLHQVGPGNQLVADLPCRVASACLVVLFPPVACPSVDSAVVGFLAVLAVMRVWPLTEWLAAGDAAIVVPLTTDCAQSASALFLSASGCQLVYHGCCLQLLVLV